MRVNTIPLITSALLINITFSHLGKLTVEVAEV